MRKPVLIAVAFAVSFAGLAAAAEKPHPPTLDLPPWPPANACVNEPTRATVIGSFEATVQGAMEYGGAVNSYSQALNQWKAAQLIEKKVWTKDDEARFGLALLSDKTFMGLANQGFTDLMAMTGAMEAFDKAKAAKDDAGACAAAVDGLGKISHMQAGVQKQWDFIAARYGGEAERLGVALD